jgi:hypothetical protein
METLKFMFEMCGMKENVSSYAGTFTENFVIKESCKCNFMFHKMLVNFLQHKLRRSICV